MNHIFCVIAGDEEAALDVFEHMLQEHENPATPACAPDGRTFFNLLLAYEFTGDFETASPPQLITRLPFLENGAQKS